MKQPLPFLNWSLSKVLDSEQDAFNRARIKILFVILLFSVLKVLIAIPVILYNHQPLHLERVIGLLIVYVVLLKLFTSNLLNINIIGHILVCVGLVMIWSNIIVFSQTINTITIQFIFMLIVSSFYLLNKRAAIIYAFLSTLPVILFTINPSILLFVKRIPNEFASPGYEIIVVLNFITIVITHYLFQQAFIFTIADKENLNKQLQLAVKEANKAAESKSDFLSTMSHELRTPLNSVIGISELLLNDSRSAEQEENLRILKFSAESLHTLINDILDYNKLGSDKLDLESISVDLYELMNDISSGLRFQARKKGIDFILDIDESIVDKRIITDPTRITQIIYNLAGNAIKFTELGSVTVCLKVRDVDDENIDLNFQVIDTGIGISSDKQEAIFEPFTQASSSTTRNFGGTGLGLAIVKRLLTMFNSNINLRSIPGVGSTFFFDISFKRDKKPVTVGLEGLETKYDLSDLKILVAEDNQMNRLLLTKVLSKWNNQPVFALNGLEAVDKVLSDSYDVILMDLHMPQMNGYEAAKAIRAIADPVKANIRIIALTASVSSNLYYKVKEAGMDDYCHKPFKINELYSKLKDGALKS